MLLFQLRVIGIYFETVYAQTSATGQILCSKLVLCYSTGFRVYLFCGTGYAYFSFLHLVHYNFLFLCCSLAHSHFQGHVWTSGVKKSCL